jgi:hypothetical protein
MEVCPMSVKPSELTWKPALRVIDGGGSEPHADSPDVVAEVLSDGTIRTLGDPEARSGDRSFATGQVAGDGWTIWWDRRYWR